jgi:hypothetical protein
MATRLTNGYDGPGDRLGLYRTVETLIVRLGVIGKGHKYIHKYM